MVLGVSCVYIVRYAPGHQRYPWFSHDSTEATGEAGNLGDWGKIAFYLEAGDFVTRVNGSRTLLRKLECAIKTENDIYLWCVYFALQYKLSLIHIMWFNCDFSFLFPYVDFFTELLYNLNCISGINFINSFEQYCI